MNDLLKMLNKKDLSLNTWQKMLDKVLRMLNDQEMKNRKMLDIPVRESMNVEYSFSMLNNKPLMSDR
ncbi:hypothetical protein [Caldibacillus debilis]|uniref:hypothetical protein n=1 Tax=Caldibacillus debilis TaxID=301148 RepID=UPI001F43C2E6|nr:hypothetical protein [Caldibacillus debilis]